MWVHYFSTNVRQSPFLLMIAIEETNGKSCFYFRQH
jgi:hypothetical protein